MLPSDTLRIQIAVKFATLGVLPHVGALAGESRCLVVSVLTSALATVVVAVAQVVSK
jgi:hypothetical protein